MILNNIPSLYADLVVCRPLDICPDKDLRRLQHSRSQHVISAVAALLGERKDFQWRSPRQVLILALIRIVSRLHYISIYEMKLI
jgi:hypothetical protein